MDQLWKEILWSQFGASIDMLGNALRLCPDELWNASMWKDPVVGGKFSEFWYVAYHCLLWLDLYLSGSDEGFVPPGPFDLNELDPQGLLPERVFTRDELLQYLSYCRNKCQETVEHLTEEKANQISTFPWKKNGLRFAELLLDNMRHVQEHAAQLGMFLGQQAGMNNRWLANPKQD